MTEEEAADKVVQILIQDAIRKVQKNQEKAS